MMKYEEIIDNFKCDEAPPVGFEDANYFSNNFNLTNNESNQELEGNAIPNNNVDGKNFNLNKNPLGKNECFLKLNFSPFLLNQLEKKYLIQIIQFIDVFCNLTIEKEYLSKIKNNIFTC